jgi:hypothetical protein
MSSIFTTEECAKRETIVKQAAMKALLSASFMLVSCLTHSST